MKKQHLIIFWVIIIIVFFGGICVGVLVKNIPILEFEKKVSILEFLIFLTTLAIGIIFPFLIKKWIDDNQTIKSYLVNEIEQLVNEISENEKLIEVSHKKGEFKKKDRDSINFIFHSSELQIESIEKQFNVSFPNAQKIVDEMKTEFRGYKDYLTGGELMISTFKKVELSFHKEHSNKYNKFKSHLKEMIHKVHRL